MHSYRDEDEKPPSSYCINAFANDGSFLDQFKRIASNKGTSKQEVSDKYEDKKRDDKCYENIKERDKDRKHRNEKTRDWESRRDRRRNDSRWGRSSDNRKHSSSSSPSPTRHRSPLSPETRHGYNQSQNGQRAQFNQQFSIHNNNHISSIPSLMSQPVMQMTNIPPPNMRNLTPNISSVHLQRLPVSKSFNNNYTNLNDHPNSARIQVAPPHILHPPPPPPPIQSIPPNTNIPPPNMQISQTVPMSNLSSPSNGQQHIIQNPQQCNLQPTVCNSSLQPPNIPPPNIPPPNILPPMSQMPPTMMPIAGSQAIVVTVPNVANVPPPSVITPMIMSAPPPVHTVPSTINSAPPPNLNIPPPNVPPPTVIQNAAPPPPRLMSTSYALSNQVPISVGPPNVQIPPPVRPPTTLQSPEQQGMISCSISINYSRVTHNESLFISISDLIFRAALTKYYGLLEWLFACVRHVLNYINVTSSFYRKLVKKVHIKQNRTLLHVSDKGF